MAKIKEFISFILVFLMALPAGYIFAESQPPLPVSGFSGSATVNSVLLSWSTPAVQNLAEFDVRYSLNPINESNFNLAVQIGNPPAPIAGANQNLNVVGLQSSTTYYFAIRLFNIAGQASSIVTTSVTTLSSGGGGGGGGGCSAPPAVSNFSAAAGLNYVDISWTTPNVFNLSEFDIRFSRNEITPTNFNLATQVAANAPAPLAGQNQTLRISGLTSNTQYYFAIKLYNICGQASSIAVTSATTNSSNLVPPVTNLSATALNQNTVRLSWQTPLVNNLAEFDIRFSRNEITPTNFNLATQVAANAPAPLAGQNQNFEITGLNSGTTYYFGIKLFHIGGFASEIVTTSATTPNSGGGGGCSAPPAVSNFSAAAGLNYVDISWTTPNVFNLSEFDIRFSRNEITPTNFNLATQVAANAPAPLAGQNQTLRISGLTSNTQYYFAIKLYNICGQASSIATVSKSTLASSGGSGGGGGSSGGGGGSSYLSKVPTNLSIFINDNATTTFTLNVNLTLQATDATEMMISNYSDFRGASWEPYKVSKNWTLTAGEGVKRVYAKFRSVDRIVSDIVSDDIIYEIPKTQPVPTPSTPASLPVQEQKPKTIAAGLVDFNTLMVRWGNFRDGDLADLNNDGKIDLRDVLVLYENWVDINVKNNNGKKLENANLLLTPNKFKVIKGKDLTLLVSVVPLDNQKKYTARVQINYPQEILELKSFTYWQDWVPVIRPGYDEYLPDKGIILKTAGYQKGFNEKKLFGVVTFKAKKSGEGIVTFSSDNAFVINANNENTLSGISFSNPVSIELLNGSYQRGFLYANLLALAQKGNFITFLAIFAILLVIYIIYRILYFQKNKKNNYTFSVKNNL